jgi:hypothetical protein
VRTRNSGDPPADAPKAFTRDACSRPRHACPASPPISRTDRHAQMRIARECYDNPPVVNDVYRSEGAETPRLAQILCSYLKAPRRWSPVRW